MTRRRPDAPRPGPTPLADILDEVMSRAGSGERHDLDRLRAAWDRLARSEGIAGTRATRLHRGALIIEVESPPVCSELAQFRAVEMLKRIRRDVGKDVAVRRLTFRLGAAPRGRNQ